MLYTLDYISVYLVAVHLYVTTKHKDSIRFKYKHKNQEIANKKTSLLLECIKGRLLTMVPHYRSRLSFLFFNENGMLVDFT